MQRQHPTNPKSHFGIYHTVNTINLNSWHPLGYIPSKYCSDRGFSKTFCFQWHSSINGLITFQKYITFVGRIMRFLVKKSQKRHQVRSITQLCIWTLYIPKTLGTIVSWHPCHSLGVLPFCLCRARDYQYERDQHTQKPWDQNTSSTGKNRRECWYYLVQ